jgi:outer membrane protein
MKTDITKLKICSVLACAVSLGITLTSHAQTAELPSLGSDPMVERQNPPGESLQDFFTAALAYSPRLRIAEESLNISSARLRQATGQLLPQLNANGSISDNRREAQGFINNFDGERYSVQLTQVLFNWRAFSARKSAALDEDRQQAEYFYEVAFLLTDVADRYLSVLQAQDALDSISSEIEALENQLAQVQSLFDRQLAQITDLRQTEASLASARAERLGLENELALAQEGLRSITGLDIGPLHELGNDVDVPEIEQSIDYWAQQARENNHRIIASEYALQAAQERVSENKGAYYPEVSFIAQRQDSNVGFDNAPQARTDNTYLGLNVSIPLYSGGTNRARVSEATSQQNIARHELRQIRLETNETVRSAYLQAQASAGRTRAAQALAESTALSAEAMQQGFEFGVVTSVDVLNALRDQYRAERDLQQARYDHIRYLLLLKREAGVLSPEDLLEVSSWLSPAQSR